MTKQRRYNSKRREQTAEATRLRVLGAAKTLFARHGIDAVTITQIAAKAGVAGPTVYAHYKSKDGILQAIMRAALFGERFQSAHAVMQGVTDSAMLVMLTAHVARAIYQSETSELGLIRGASAFSPALRKIEAQFEKLRFDMQAERIALLFSQAKQKPGLDVQKAHRIMWMYTSRDIYRMLVQEGGWTPEQYQEWLSTTLLQALVEPATVAALVRAREKSGNARGKPG
jgi:AcrR family transcriptional regulator